MNYDKCRIEHDTKPPNKIACQINFMTFKGLCRFMEMQPYSWSPFFFDPRY